MSSFIATQMQARHGYRVCEDEFTNLKTWFLGSGFYSIIITVRFKSFC